MFVEATVLAVFETSFAALETICKKKRKRIILESDVKMFIYRDLIIC